jgi:hypothetical protein
MTLTEDEHRFLTERGNEFYAAYSKLLRESLAKVPEGLRDFWMMRLSEMSNPYSADIDPRKEESDGKA